MCTYSIRFLLLPFILLLVRFLIPIVFDLISGLLKNFVFSVIMTSIPQNYPLPSNIFIYILLCIYECMVIFC